MKNSDSALLSIYLKAGEVFISEKPAQVTTILGSCVTVTMFSSQLKIGAMCHGFLPNCRDYDKCDKDISECLKFVDCSLWKMTDQFKMYGIERGKIQLKMFGGASILTSGTDPGSRLAVGNRNIEAAKQFINEAGLSIAAYNVGGTSGRKIIFYTHTGEVWLKMLKPLKALTSE